MFFYSSKSLTSAFSATSNLIALWLFLGISASIANAAPVTEISLWNGNKTESRQEYEREVLVAALAATSKTHGDWNLSIDNTDYPTAEDEASVFRTKGFDIFGTVAGNPKLASEKKILVPLPLMKGLLGYRILIIRAEDKEKFAAIKSANSLKKLRMGIPATWADAELFRKNGYQVIEKGSFDDVFTRLHKNEFDYVSFGANEVTGVFADRAASVGKLAIDQSLLVYYPFPLVFYVNPNNKALAERVILGLETITANGELDKIFNRYFGKDLAQLKLKERQVIELENPLLPAEMAEFKPGI